MCVCACVFMIIYMWSVCMFVNAVLLTQILFVPRLVDSTSYSPHCCLTRILSPPPCWLTQAEVPPGRMFAVIGQAQDGPLLVESIEERSPLRSQGVKVRVRVKMRVRVRVKVGSED